MLVKRDTFRIHRMTKNVLGFVSFKRCLHGAYNQYAWATVQFDNKNRKRCGKEDLYIKKGHMLQQTIRNSCFFLREIGFVYNYYEASSSTLPGNVSMSDTQKEQKPERDPTNTYMNSLYHVSMTKRPPALASSKVPHYIKRTVVKKSKSHLHNLTYL